MFSLLLLTYRPTLKFRSAFQTLVSTPFSLFQ